MSLRSLTAFALASSLLVGSAAAQPASPVSARLKQASGQSVPAEVLIILASEAAGAIDPRLADVAALRRPPFNAYHTMALLSSPHIQLRVGQAREVPLPNGRRVRILLREITSEGRFRLQVSINRPGQQDYLPEMTVETAPGDPFFVAGQSYQEGLLVIGFRLGGRSAERASARGG